MIQMVMLAMRYCNMHFDEFFVVQFSWERCQLFEASGVICYRVSDVVFGKMGRVAGSSVG
jgi:hypothetical protein